MMTERFPLLRFAGFRGAHPLAKTGALRQRRLAASSTGRVAPPLPSEAFTAVLKLDNNDD